jgi:hypothetical protein
MSAPADLSGYKVEFFRVPLFDTWSWRATAPNGEVVGPLLSLGGWAHKECAEENAVRRLRQHASRHIISGLDLEERVEQRNLDRGAGERS